MTFREFITMQETMTSTANIAGYSRITLPLVQRTWPSDLSDEANKKRKKPYRQPQVEEGISSKWRSGYQLPNDVEVV